MISEKRTLFQILVVFIMICLLQSGAVQAASSTVKVTVRKDLIDIHAENAFLIDVLDAISSKTGIVVKSGQPLREIVSIDFRGLELDQVVKRLMAQHNYSHAIFYDKYRNGRTFMTELHVFGENALKLIAMKEPAKTLNAARQPDDHFKRFEKKSFKESFQDKKKMIKLISATPMENSFEGIQVKSVEKNSFFASLGICQGDIIKNINGSPVRSVNELIDGLAPSLLPAMIRIEREDSNAMINPIYIKFN